MSRLKVFHGHYGGRHEAIVAATSQKAAAAIAGISLSAFRDYWGETGNAEQIAQAMSEPGVLFIRPDRARAGEPWTRKAPRNG